MRKSYLFIIVFCLFGLTSCQCSTKPNIGPVEDPSSEMPGDPAIERPDR